MQVNLSAQCPTGCGDVVVTSDSFRNRTSLGALIQIPTTPDCVQHSASLDMLSLSSTSMGSRSMAKPCPFRMMLNDTLAPRQRFVTPFRIQASIQVALALVFTLKLSICLRIAFPVSLRQPCSYRRALVIGFLFGISLLVTVTARSSAGGCHPPVAADSKVWTSRN